MENLAELQKFMSTDMPPEFDSYTPKLQLVLEEFLVNIFNYAYSGSPGPLEVQRRLVNFDGEPHISVLVRDWGPAFDPFIDSPPPDLSSPVEDRPIGGLGVHLVKSLATHYSYIRVNEANTLEIWFRQPTPSAAKV
jgi:anti-sigma regulatory factor (Ser/Thr protein kinase)